MKDKFISDEFYSNCLIEAIKAKMRDKSVKIYFCKPRRTENGRLQMCHFMWSNGAADYDFSDREEHNLKWYQSLWFKGAIRQFECGFAKRYSDFRNENVNLRRSEKSVKGACKIMSKAIICDKCGKVFSYYAPCKIDISDSGRPLHLDLCNTCRYELLKWINNKDYDKTKHKTKEG